jgi:hypothetical protein
MDSVLTYESRIRLYSTKTFKSLGTLEYHKDGCQSLAFARVPETFKSDDTQDISAADDSEDEDMSEEDKAKRSRWLASGGKDTQVAVWALISFDK